MSKIRSLVPGFSEYREPFLGGGSVFIFLKQLHPKAIYKINDLNQDLYCFWSTVQKDADEFTDEVIRIRDTYKDGKKLYRKLVQTEDASDHFRRAIRFYVLNRITYSGTIDSGGYSAEAFEKRFTKSNIEKIGPLSDLLQDVEITNERYESLLFENGKDVFIYLDPPYWKSMKSKLYGKSGDLHTSFDHRQFAENAEKCKHRWLITCDNSGFIRKLFTFARTHMYPWEMQYGMNNVKKERSSKGKELLITNYALDKTLGKNSSP